MTTLWALQAVTVAYPTPLGTRTVLEDVTLDIAAGEWVAIVGANGSGKSTLVKVLAGLIGVSRGSVKNSRQHDADSAHAGFVPLVFQNPEAQIIGETVEEDLYFGMECQGLNEIEKQTRATQALTDVGLLAHRTQRVAYLSGGQKQRLAIANALATHHPAIIFDEATSMLDKSSRQAMLAVARQLHETGKTIIWVTQWLEELAAATRVIALANGRVAYDGTVTAFMYEPAGPSQSAPTTCEQLGFALPFTVAMVRQLQNQGVVVPGQPLTLDELAEALTR